MKTPRQRVLDDVGRIAEEHGVLPAVVLSLSRQRQAVVARAAAYYHIREQYGWSFSQIADLFGTTHDTVRHGIGRHLAATGRFDPALDNLRVTALKRNDAWRGRIRRRSA